MERHDIEQTARPAIAGLVVLLTLLVLFGAAVRDPRPHNLPVGLVAPTPVADQLANGFAQNAPGAIAFTQYATEAEARTAIDNQDVVAAVLVSPAGPRLIVAGAAGDAAAGGITTAFSGAFAAQGQQLAVETVHPFGAGDAHGIILFFLILATLVSSVIVGALTVLAGRPGWRWQLASLVTFAILAGIAGALTAAWIANDYWDAIFALMALVALLAYTISVVVAAAARAFGPAGVAGAVLLIILVGLISSGGPLGSYFLPDLYRAVAPWLPVGAAHTAIVGALYFGGAGTTYALLVLVAWATLGTAGLLLARVAWPARLRAQQVAA
jgi:hypothetical protein